MIPISELNLVKIGEIIRTHGYKGEAVVKLSVDFERLNLTELTFLIIDGNKVPFFFSYPPKPYKKSGLLIKLDNINSDKEIEKILHSPVLTEEKNIVPESSEATQIPKGFNVFNREQLIGKSGEYLNIPSNPIITVYSDNNQEILIPLNDKFIKEINYDKKVIIFDLPDGLIDVNE